MKMKILGMLSVGALFMVTASAIALMSTPVAFADQGDCDSGCWNIHEYQVGECIDEFPDGQARYDCFDDAWEQYLTCAGHACQGV